MIKTGKLVPSIYYKRSRDFQLFGRLYDIIFNYLKTNIDLINNPLSKDLSLLYLNTLGFFPKRVYDNDLIVGLCKSYSDIIRNKGSLYSLELATNVVLKAAKIESPTGQLYHIEQDLNDKNTYNVYLNDSIGNIEVCLLEEVLDYILPIGVSINIKSISFSDSLPVQQLNIKNTDDIQLDSNCEQSAMIRTVQNVGQDNNKVNFQDLTLKEGTGDIAAAAEANNDTTYQGSQPFGTITRTEGLSEQENDDEE